MPSRAVLGLALLLETAGCAHYPRLSLATSVRLEADTHLLDLSHMDAVAEDDWIVRVVARDGSCSGALVEPGVVLTAAHCVVAHDDPQTRIAPGDLRVELGGDYLPWGRVGVVEVVRCGCWDGQARGDVAALVLETDIPSAVPLGVPRLDREPEEDEDVFASGFGTYTGSRVVPVSGWAQRALLRGWQRGVTTAVMDGAFVLSGVAKPGDSGGPVISRLTGEILGVISRGTEGEVGVDPNAQVSPDADHVRYTIAARVDTCSAVLRRAHAIATHAPEGTWPKASCQ